MHVHAIENISKHTVKVAIIICIPSYGAISINVSGAIQLLTFIIVPM